MSRPAASGAVSLSDLAIVSGQLGRTARDVTGIAVRCPFGRPVVIETSPTLAGVPNPTLLYLTCPSAVNAISRAESAGGVRALKSACDSDPALLRALDEVTVAYRRRRARLAPGGDPRPEAGIGGPGGPERASCLHAYTAALLAARAGWLDGTALDHGAERGAAPAPAGGPAGSAGEAAALAWERLLPPRDELWCSDDRCARWAEGRGEAGDQAWSAAAAGGHQSGAEKVCGETRGADRVAAIDIGTISVRLLVADIHSGRPEQVVRHAEVTRLGEGLRPGGQLGEAAVSRTKVAVARYAQEARRLGACRIVLAGTSATRQAADGAEFMRRLGEENRVAAAVLSGAEEAALAHTGASLDMEGDFVVLDVGGGSTELIRRSVDGAVEAISLELGASRATERWISSDPPSARELAAVYDEAAAALAPLRPRFGAGSGLFGGVAGSVRLVGVAGTVTTLACLDAGLQAYDAETIHLRTLSLEAVDRLVARLAGMTGAERAALSCVQAGRAPVIVGGAVIVRAALEALGYGELTVSERDLLDGLVLTAPC